MKEGSKIINKKNHPEIYEWLVENIYVSESHSMVFSEDWEDFNETYSGNFSLTDKGKIDVDGVNVMVKEDVSKLIHHFGDVYGSFVFYPENDNLITLIGSPDYVYGDYSCSGCSFIGNLKGCPKKIDGYFQCARCYNLQTLEDGPDYVGKGFDCCGCSSLKSLKGLHGLSDYCILEFDECEDITSFLHCPEEIYNNFSCTYCSILSLKGFPKRIEGRIELNNEFMSNNPKYKDKYKIYLAMWLEFFESVTNKEREIYIKSYKDREDFNNKKPIIPIEILKEYGW